MPKIPERFAWATQQLDVQPGDSILEIGCGAGVWAALIADRLGHGTLTAVDKSRAMLALAKKRNSTYIKNKRAAFVPGDFQKAPLPLAAFDKIVAFNVNAFGKEPALAFARVRELLKPNGTLYLFYQAPYELTIKAAEPYVHALRAGSFQVTTTAVQKMKPTSVLAIAARR